MHEGVVTIVEKIETPCTTSIDIDDVNKGIKKMRVGKKQMQPTSQVSF